MGILVCKCVLLCACSCVSVVLCCAVLHLCVYYMWFMHLLGVTINMEQLFARCGVYRKQATIGSAEVSDASILMCGYVRVCFMCVCERVHLCICMGLWVYGCA